MKILSISFLNINSLKGEHEIDFTGEKFQRNPLFAITGPTGSGKTTVLDVISLALFNKIPRMGKVSNSVIEEQGALLTKNQKEAYAQVTFLCSAGKFTSIWSISTNRNNKLRDYEMELSQREPDETLDLKKSEVPGKNEELIGLNYSQFNKSVMLAQGEFAEFLKAPEKVRSQLLEQITGTSIYRELGIKAYRRYKDENDEIDYQKKQLEEAREELLGDERKKELKKKLREAEDFTGEIEQKLESTKKELERKTELKQLEKQIEERQSEFQKASQQKKGFREENGAPLENHRAVQGFSTELQTWKHQRKDFVEQEKQEKTLTRKGKKLNSEQGGLLKNIEEFVHREVPENKVGGALQEFAEKVHRLQEERKDLGQKFQEQERSFDREIQELEQDFSVRDLMKNPAPWEDYMLKTQKKLKGAREKFPEEIPSDLERAKEQVQQKINLAQGAKKDRSLLQKFEKDISRKTAPIKKLENKLQPVPEQLKELKSRKQLEEEQLKRLQAEQETHLMRARLDDYRELLEEDKACPLCGSTEHPFATEKPETKTDFKAKIRVKERELNETKEQYSSLTTQQKSWKQQLEENRRELEEKKKEYGQLKENFRGDYQGKTDWSQEDWEAKIKKEENYLVLLKDWGELTKINSAIEKAAPIVAELKTTTQKGKKIKSQIQKVYDGKDILGDRRKLEKAWDELGNQLRFNQEQIRETRKKLGETEKKVASLEENLQPRLNSTGFKDLTEAEKALMPQERYDSLLKQKEELEKKTTIIQSEIQTLEKRFQERAERLDSKQDRGSLEREKKELTQKLKEQQEAKNENRRLLKNDLELREKVEGRTKKIKEQEYKNRRWKLLSELIGSSTGDKFNKFAQHLTLRHLLKLANRRLQEISERYRLDPYSANGQDLVIADLDMGGQRRSVQTLSGGETFLLSLSLALALSDLASKNININSLFIDEGFGTLDPETLDQTLDTLERLQASSSKTIGIISHVESLKERIGTQIQLSKNGQGYSSLRVV